MTTPPRSLAPNLDRDAFVDLAGRECAAGGTPVIPLTVRLLADQLTPVLAYRRLVVEDERTAPSFLFESVEGGDRQGRHSILGAHPVIEIVARRNDVSIRDRRHPPARGGEGLGEGRTATSAGFSETVSEDPLGVVRDAAADWRPVIPAGRAGAVLPQCMIGGWVGYASYDSVRYAEPEKLAWGAAPPDDRDLPDLHFGLYDEVVVFDHVDKLVHVVRSVPVCAGEDAGAAYDRAIARLARTVEALQTHSRPLRSGQVGEGLDARRRMRSNMTVEQHAAMVERAREYIRAGDIFQVVVGQRFERTSRADPFDVYRALRVVNPSPYMVYLQAEGCMLVASSPEILCRVRRDGDGALVVTNRPLAGTRRRGESPEEDAALERELLADEKERAEHVMLVDLGRNDVGKVAERASIALPALMQIERYSHVMHISSTVTGRLRDGLDCWDALRATLPVGTISGAPKIRAMQIIDELEPVRRGPYGGGFGYVSLSGEMDIALALRTIVVPTAMRSDRDGWTYHLQAAGGIVHDSKPGPEHEETVSKAAALVGAIDLAESAFGTDR